jgi:hypothetical protein
MFGLQKVVTVDSLSKKIHRDKPNPKMIYLFAPLNVFIYIAGIYIKEGMSFFTYPQI